MVKLMFCVVRRSDVAEPEFHRYWREEHGPLVISHAATLRIARYVQSHTAQPSLNLALAATRGAPSAYDGVAELWFEDLDALGAAATPAGAAAAAALLEDERRFIDHARSPLFLTEELAVI
jgi:uncharacterized protein (TIGR02118 family)